MENYTLEEMIEGCKNNQRLMQKALYQQFSARLYAICLRYLRNEEDAQDVLQHVFIKIFGQIHTYKETGVFEGWIKKITVHTAITFLRKKNIHFEELFSDNSKKYCTSDTYVMKEMEVKEIIQQIQKLPDGYRTVFNMYVIEGFSHREIATQLNISENTSKSQLSRARAILQEKIKKQEEVEKQYGH